MGGILRFHGFKQTLVLIVVLLALLPSLFLGYLIFTNGPNVALPGLVLLGVVLGLAILAVVKIHALFAAVSQIAEALRGSGTGGEKWPSAHNPGIEELTALSEAFHYRRESIEQDARALKQRDLELNAIRNLTEVLDRVQSMEEFLRRLLLEKSMDATNARIGSVFLHDPAAGRLRMVAAKGIDHVEESYSVAIDDSLMKAVVSERKPLVVRNIEEDPRTLKPNAPRYGAPSFLSMPIHMGDELIGVLNLSHKEEGRPFDAADERITAILCDEIALALERIHLRTRLDLQEKRLKEQDLRLERERAERQEAEEQWKRYKFIVDVSRRFMTLINRDYVYEAASDAFCRAHCLLPEDVVGRSVSDIWGEKDFQGIIRAYLDRCFSGEEVTYEDSFEFPALGLQHFSVSYWPYRNDEGVVTHAMVFTQNITERKKLEGQLNQAQKLKALGTLAGGIAHDFNNLLMAIQGYTSLTLIGMDSRNPDYERLKAVEKQVLAGVNLTRQLLGFARGGKYEVRPLDMNEVLDQTATMFGRTKKQIQICKSFQEGIWSVEADLNQIEQVLLNLYLNAWQAMPGGGRILIETANHRITESDQHPPYMKPGRYVKASITDTGVGMDEETQQRIFEPFFTTREMGRGVGLGLAMVYGIIKNHDGYITVQSTKGQGTTFSIFMPASEKTPVTVTEGKAPEAPLMGEGTVLLVDDEEAIVAVMKEMMGYQVLVADNGRDALRVFEENRDRIDLVILDMIMPGLSGGDTFNGLKKIAPQVKVILASGYSLNSEAAAIMARGCRGFLQKPVNMETLSRKVREALEK